MSMTRDEAITNLEKLVALFRTASEQSELVDYSKIIETLEFAAAALRPVSRERVEKAWRGEWIECQTAFGEKYNKCSRCGFTPSFGYPAFCASCGSANTGEAVQMVMERLEALYETT